MIFSEPRFLLFFLLVFSVHWALRSNAARKHVLLAASLYFYGSWDARFLALIVAASLCDWFCSLRIAAARARGAQPRRWLMVSLCYNLGTLGFFKYFNFFADSAVAFLQWLGLPASPVTLQIVLPVGISFFTFQTMSYTLDVWRGDLKPVRSPLDVLLYVTFFPQLVAGPIVRAATFLPQLDVARRFRDVDVQRAVGQFLSGFIKKSVVADLIAGPVDQVFGPPAGVVVPPGEAFGPPADYSAASIWIAVVCYAVQIYCDFSGYSDMAIGAARLLGYELCENFRFPYLAANITDFWRRWHMSLSSWLRDSLYISLDVRRLGGDPRRRARGAQGMAAARRSGAALPAGAATDALHRGAGVDLLPRPHLGGLLGDGEGVAVPRLAGREGGRSRRQPRRLAARRPLRRRLRRVVRAALRGEPPLARGDPARAPVVARDPAVRRDRGDRALLRAAAGSALHLLPVLRMRP
jgi:D-alanyl-lipoteichoic acid acyltransferase DltB (MBOAT superfamily)